MHAERMRERVLRQVPGLEALLGEREREDAIDRERAQLIVFGHERDEIEPALREDEALRLDQYAFSRLLENE